MVKKWQRKIGRKVSSRYCFLVIKAGNNRGNTAGDGLCPVLVTYVNEREIGGLRIRVGVSRRRQIGPISRVHVSAGTVQTRAPLVF